MSLKSLTRPIRCYRLFEDPTQRRFHDFIRGPTQNGASISIPKYSADFSCCRYIQGPVKLAEDSWRICFSRLTTVSLPISLYLILPLPHSPSTSFSLYLILPLPHPGTIRSISPRDCTETEGRDRYQEDATSIDGLQLPAQDLQSSLQKQDIPWDLSKSGSPFLANQVAFFGIYDG